MNNERPTTKPSWATIGTYEEQLYYLSDLYDDGGGKIVVDDDRLDEDTLRELDFATHQRGNCFRRRLLSYVSSHFDLDEDNIDFADFPTGIFIYDEEGELLDYDWYEAFEMAADWAIRKFPMPDHARLYPALPDDDE
jgi:hypothetical protein